MRIYKCYKNQENRRGPELIGKFSITDECKIAVGIDGNKIYLQARKNIGNALDKILHLAFNYNTGKFQLNQMHNGIWEG
ncbi:hypothetical protein, partial [Parabacteroides goldsteinii]|uniref:hypothetical protein n=1 Tax=Parabacteroides goldsteinii TaxID=328812 RepID=UPI0025B6AE1B